MFSCPWIESREEHGPQNKIADTPSLPQQNGGKKRDSGGVFCLLLLLHALRILSFSTLAHTTTLRAFFLLLEEVSEIPVKGWASTKETGNDLNVGKKGTHEGEESQVAKIGQATEDKVVLPTLARPPP